MSYLFTVSPDFTPDHLSGWYIFNTWMQKQLAIDIHLELYDSFCAQRLAIDNNQIDLIYANPFDTTMLVREKGFLPLVKPANLLDEALFAVREDSAIYKLTDLQANVKIGTTEDPDVTMIGMMLLESVDLNKHNIEKTVYDSYVLVAKNLLRSNDKVGLFLASAYDDLSNMIKKQLRVLLRSKIDEIHHSLLISPQLVDKQRQIQTLLLTMDENEKGRGVLDALGFSAWHEVDDNEMEFMIDLMETLVI